MSDTTLPFDPAKPGEERYTAADAAQDPIRKEAEVEPAKVAVEEAKENRLREERILDLPVAIRVGKDEYQFTSRPMGFVKMALAEFLGISGIIADIQHGMKRMIEGEEGEDGAISQDDIADLLIEKGDDASKIMYKIVQILLEPVSGGPPNLAEPKVSLTKIEWEMEVSEIAFLFSKFLQRDIFALGGAVKNLIGFSQQT